MRCALRTPVLDDRYHRGYIWRSDQTRTAYRYLSGWQMFYDGGWQRCYNESGPAYFGLISTCGEVFIRVGQEL